MVRFGVPGQNVDTLSYADSRLSTVPVVQAPRRPTVTDKKFPIWCEWRTNKESQAPVVEGEFWKLIRFESNGDATWVQMDSGSGLPGVDDLRDQVNVQVTPDINGNIDIDGAIVANGTNPSSIPLETVADVGTNTLDIQLQLGTAVTPTPGDANDAGILSANEDHFTVDATSGMFSLKGGGTTPALTKVDVDFNTGPGVDPVLADATGLMNIRGNTVTNATNTDAPVATHSRALNTFQVDVQLATTIPVSPADPYDVGLASYNEKHFFIDSNGCVSSTSGAQVKGWSNLGVSYSAGTFTVRGADADLSATNPASVTFQSKSTPGELVTVQVTANQDFIDDAGASEIIGNLFGLTTSIAYDEDMPFFIYAVINDDEDAVAFGISRSPIMQTSSGSAAIGTPAAANADGQGSIFLFNSVTVTEYDNNPVVLLGSIRMQMSASDDWTVQTLTKFDGIGQFQLQRIFTGVEGQFGADASSFFSDSAGTGTQPTFSGGSSYSWMLDINGYITVKYGGTTVSNTPAGAGTLRLHVPVVPLLSNKQAAPGHLSFNVNSSGNYSHWIPRRDSISSVNYFFFTQSGAGLLTPATIANADTDFIFTVTYKGFQQQV